MSSENINKVRLVATVQKFNGTIIVITTTTTTITDDVDDVRKRRCSQLMHRQSAVIGVQNT